MSDEGGKVWVEVDGHRIRVQRGRPLLNELLSQNIVVSTACGGKGSCHLCRIAVLPGSVVDAPTAAEERALGNVLLAAGMRLACQIRVEEPLRVRVPRAETKQERLRRLRERRRSLKTRKGET